MSETKRPPGRMNPFRKLPLELQGRRLEDYERAIEKLQLQCQSLEEEVKALYQPRSQLEQAQKQNERLVEALQEARAQIAALKDEVEKLTSPPLQYGIFSSSNPDGTLNVFVGGKKLKVSGSSSLKAETLKKGQELILNDGLTVVELSGFETQGEVATVKNLMDDRRAIVTLRADEDRVAELSEMLIGTSLNVGDHVLYDPRSGYLFEKLPRSEVEEIVIEEIPDVTYDAIGGLEAQIEALRDAVELPFLYPDLFAEYKLQPPKGVLLYGPPGCGKTLIGKALANSIAKKLGDATGKEVRSYFLHVKGPELLNKYVGESERQIREIFKKAREKARQGMPVIIFFDEMDALFRMRGTGISSDIEATIVPQLLSEIDGIERLQHVIVIGASNRQDLIDPAVLRPGRLDVKIRVDRPNQEAAREIFAKYLRPDLPFHSDELAKDGGDPDKTAARLIGDVAARMYSPSEENRFLEVTYANGEKEMLYYRDFASGALIEGIVSRAKKYAIKRMIAAGEKGLTLDDVLRALCDEFREHEDLPNTTNPDDWVKIAGRRNEKIVHVRTISGQAAESRKIETVPTGHFL